MSASRVRYFYNIIIYINMLIMYDTRNESLAVDFAVSINLTRNHTGVSAAYNYSAWTRVYIRQWYNTLWKRTLSLKCCR